MNAIVKGLAVWVVASGAWAAPVAAQYPSGEGPPDEEGGDATDQGPDDQADREARDLYRAGTAAFQDGRFEDALSRWQEAYALSARPELRYNIATALDRLGRMSEAVEHYEAFLEARPDADNANYIERRVTVIRGILERESGEDEDAADDAADVGDEAGPSPAAAGPSRVGPIVLFSVAGASAITAVITGTLADQKYRALEDRCDAGRCTSDLADERDSLRTLTTVTDVLLAVTLAAAAGGVVWWIVGGSSNTNGTEVACGPARCWARTSF